MALTQIPHTSVEAVGKFIEDGKQSDGTNPTLTLWQNLARGGNEQARGILSAHQFYTTHGSSQLEGDLPTGVYGNIKGISDAFRNAVERGGPEMWNLVTAPPKAVIDAFKSGTIKAVGITPDSVDLHAAMLAQQGINPGALSMIKSNWEKLI